MNILLCKAEVVSKCHLGVLCSTLTPCPLQEGTVCIIYKAKFHSPSSWIIFRCPIIFAGFLMQLSLLWCYDLHWYSSHDYESSFNSTVTWKTILENNFFAIVKLCRTDQHPRFSSFFPIKTWNVFLNDHVIHKWLFWPL